jgi:DNA-binding transcriptional LysR family regulator
MELGSTEAIKQALITGLGVSILSKTAIEREVKDGLLKAIPIRGLKLERDFYRVVHRRRSLSPVGRAFLQFLSRSLTENSR